MNVLDTETGDEKVLCFVVQSGELIIKDEKDFKTTDQQVNVDYFRYPIEKEGWF